MVACPCCGDENLSERQLRDHLAAYRRRARANAHAIDHGEAPSDNDIIHDSDDELHSHESNSIAPSDESMLHYDAAHDDGPAPFDNGHDWIDQADPIPAEHEGSDGECKSASRDPLTQVSTYISLCRLGRRV